MDCEVGATCHPTPSEQPKKNQGRCRTPSCRTSPSTPSTPYTGRQAPEYFWCRQLAPDKILDGQLVWLYGVGVKVPGPGGGTRGREQQTAVRGAKRHQTATTVGLHLEVCVHVRSLSLSLSLSLFLSLVSLSQSLYMCSFFALFPSRLSLPLSLSVSHCRLYEQTRICPKRKARFDLFVNNFKRGPAHQKRSMT
jgi:hypothetical protein